MSDLSDALMSTPTAVTAGWSQLGRVLGGGGQASANAYQRGVMQGAQVSDVMEQARRRRDQNIGFTNITPATVQAALAGDPNAQADLISAEQHAGGGNAEQLAQGLQTGQKTGFLGALMQQARGGASIGQLNPQLAVLGGKVVDTSKVEGNTLINPTVDPNQQSAYGGNVPTAVGQSDITRAMAEAQASRAAAGEHSAQAQRALAGINADKAANYELATDATTGQTVRINKLTGQELPVMDTGGNPVLLQGHGGASSDAALKPEEIEEALGKPPIGGKSNPDYVAFKNYQSLHAQDDPQFKSDRYALSRYLQAKEGTALAAKNATNAPHADADGNVVIPPISQSFGQAMQEVSQGNQGRGAPAGAPSAAAPASVVVGQTATNPKTGQKIQWNGNAWVPING